MASFTDSVHGFNPYVKTLPVDAYTAVGMYKEQKLEEGINKVQQYVNSVAGLPIDKADIREYVQGKLGQMKQALGDNISGDFSNQRLVSQIGGAVSKIESDPVVVNGMAGTAALRAGAAAIAEAKKTGKGYGVENEARFNYEANQWQNDGDLTSSFRGGYSPYVDVIGKAMELYGKMNPSDNIPEGALRYGADGKVEVNPTLVNGVSAGRIQNVLNLVYQQPDVQRQLGITGWYNYGGLSSEDLSKNLKDTTNATLNNITETARALQMKLVTDANANAEDITKQIEELKEQAVNIKKEFTGDVNLINANPDAYKTKLVRDGITQNFMGAYATSTMKKSPLWDAYMDVAKQELDIAKFDYQKIKDAKDYELGLAEYQLKLAAAAQKKEGTDLSVVTTTGNVEEAAGKLGSATFDELVVAKKAELGQATMGLVFNLFNTGGGVLNPIKTLPGGGYTLNVDEKGISGYKTPAEAEKVFGKAYTEARAESVGGNPRATVLQAFDKVDPVIRDVRYYDGIQKELGSRKSAVVEEVRKQTGSGNTDFIDAYIIENKLTNWQDSEKRLKGRYGNDWQGGLGLQTPKEGNMDNISQIKIPHNLKAYEDFKDKFDATLAPKFQALEEEYKSKQLGISPLYSTILASKTEEKEDVRQRFEGISGPITEGNYSNKAFREIVAADDKGKYKANSYGGYQDPFNNKYYLTVKRGKGESEKMEVSKRQFESIPGLRVSNDFWKEYGSSLSLTNNETTDVLVNGKREGLGTAYRLIMPRESKYDVRYHITGNGTGERWNMKLYIKDKTDGHLIMGPVDAGLDTTMEGILTIKQQLTNDLAIEGVMNQNRGSQNK